MTIHIFYALYCIITNINIFSFDLGHFDLFLQMFNYKAVQRTKQHTPVFALNTSSIFVINTFYLLIIIIIMHS